MEFKYQTKDAYYFNKLKPLFPYLKMTKGFIAGGVFKDIFLDKPFRDIDFFFENEEDFIKSRNAFIQDPSFKLKYRNGNAYGFINESIQLNIELICKKFGSPTEILNGFDFSVSKFALYSFNNDLYVKFHPLFFEDLSDKKLRFDLNERSPINQLKRILKYSRYGFIVESKDIHLLLNKINQLDSSAFDEILFSDTIDHYY